MAVSLLIVRREEAMRKDETGNDETWEVSAFRSGDNRDRIVYSIHFVLIYVK